MTTYRHQSMLRRRAAEHKPDRIEAQAVALAAALERKRRAYLANLYWLIAINFTVAAGIAAIIGAVAWRLS